MSETREWIDVPGTGCPVDDDTHVEVLYGSGKSLKGRAELFNWLAPYTKIVAYRPAPLATEGEGAMNDNRTTRWKAVCLYRTDAGFIDIEHYFEEVEELHDLIERGPHWDTLIRCTITLNRPAEDRHMTVERAEAQ